MGRSTQALNGLRKRFGENLIRLRNRVDLSQVETAKRSGLHLTEVSLLERGLRLPRLDTIVKLAGAVEAEPCELLTGMVWHVGRVQRGEWTRQGAYAPKDSQPSRSR
jgi:transcriptional regulator with XRE-family HTH domain